MSVSGSTSGGSTSRGNSPAGGRTGLRFVGIEINLNAQIWSGLTSIFGVGKPTAMKICKDVGVDPMKKARLVTSEEEGAIREALATYAVEGDLRRRIAGNKMRLQKIRAYRGLRHFMGLPCRGQNTRNNAKTASRVK